jgi:hypothetical protein
MRQPVIIAGLLLACGCAAHRGEQTAYIYKAPVAVSLTNLRHTNDDCIATVVVTNESESPVWFEDMAVDEPAFSVEWKGHYYGFPWKVNGSRCTGGGQPRELTPGKSCSFPVEFDRSVQMLGPFRVGVWVWTCFGVAIPQDVFWSDYVSP